MGWNRNRIVPEKNLDQGTQLKNEDKQSYQPCMLHCAMACSIIQLNTIKIFHTVAELCSGNGVLFTHATVASVDFIWTNHTTSYCSYARPTQPGPIR